MWFTVMAGIGIILSAVYTLNMIRKVFYGETNDLTAGATDLRIGEIVSLSIIVILVFWMGVYPKEMLELTDKVSQSIVEKIGVLHLNGAR